jgi:hypothetical protein
MLRGSTEILDTVCKHVGGVKPGETTKDGKWTVIEVECQGACSNAPMVVIGDDFYVREFLAQWVLMESHCALTGGSYTREHHQSFGCFR